MTRRHRHRSELLHIIISLLNHKLGATSAAAQAAYECLHLHPFLPWLPIRMVVLVWFLRRKKKEGGKENSPSTVPVKHVQDSQSYEQADLIVLFPAFFILQIHCFICRLFTDTQLLLFISSSG